MAGAASAIQTMARIIPVWILAVIVIGQTVGRLELAAERVPWISLGLVHLTTLVLLFAAARHRI